jgi:hypothetical protein
MRNITAEKLSIVLGGGIFGVALVGLLAAGAGITLPLAAEGVGAIAGMLAGARVA